MIKSLTIQGYKGQKARADYDLAKYTFVLGDNAAGKSSFINGLRTALLGYVPEGTINVGEKDAVALVTMDDGTEIKTDVPFDSPTAHYLNGKKESKRAVADIRAAYVKMPPEIAEIFFREGQFCLNLKPEEFSKLIGSVLPAMTSDALLKALKVTPEEEAVYRTVYAGTSIDFDTISKIYKTLSERLREINKDIAASEQAAKMLSATTTGRPTELLKQKRDSLLAKLGEYRASEQAAKEYENKKASYDAYVAELKALQGKLANKPAKVEAGEIDNAINRLNRIAQKIKDESTLVALLKNNMETASSVLAELETSVCPISKKLICTTDKSGVRAELEKSFTENQRAYDIHTKQVQTLESIKKGTEEEIRSLREKERQVQEYMRLEEKLQAMRENAPVMPVKPTSEAFDPEPVVKKELEAINAEIANASNAEQAKKLLVTIATKKNEQATVETLRQKMAPKGEAYSIILAMVCGTLNTEINASAADLGSGREYEFRVGEGMTLWGRKTASGSDMIPVKGMSTGERFIAHLTLLSLINKIAGVPFIVLDNIDCLDENNLERVLAMVTSPAYASRFENVVLAGVNHTDSMKKISDLIANRNDCKVITLVA